MSNLIVEPLNHEELDDFIRVHWDAFEPLEANMILPMIYSKGLRPDLLQRLRERIFQETNGNLGSLCFCAKDASSGEIVAVSRWANDSHSPKTKA